MAKSRNRTCFIFKLLEKNFILQLEIETKSTLTALSIAKTTQIWTRSLFSRVKDEFQYHETVGRITSFWNDLSLKAMFF